MNKIITAFICVLLSILVAAQSYNVKINPTLLHLYNSKNEIGTIGNTEKLVVFPLKVGNQQAKFKLLKNKLGLFALVDGTGQVYKATNLNHSQLTFTRFDSTHFYGNTFESINFTFKGTIYNFGGYGFWNRNGQLSHFTLGSEWTIDKINNQFTTTNKFYTYQPNESKIYYVEFPWNAEATFDKIENTTVIQFDINKKENKRIGKINPKIDLNYNYFSIDIPSLNGILHYYERDIFLYNLSANKVYKLINSKIKDELIGKAGSELQTTFEDEGKVYYSFNNDTTLRSLEISMNDFKEEPYPIYIPEHKESITWIVILFLSLITFAISLLIYFKRKNKYKLGSTNKEEPYSTDLNSNDFNSIETTLINNLIEKSNNDSHLTVDELNLFLGIKKKTIEIQKRVRTEAINRINHKFNVNFNLETTFIERTRSNDDRRYFNYTISKENAKIYQNFSK